MSLLSNVLASGPTVIEWNLLAGTVSAHTNMGMTIKPALDSRSTSVPPPVLMTQIVSLAFLINHDSTTTKPSAASTSSSSSSPSSSSSTSTMSSSSSSASSSSSSSLPILSLSSFSRPTYSTPTGSLSSSSSSTSLTSSLTLSSKASSKSPSPRLSVLSLMSPNQRSETDADPPVPSKELSLKTVKSAPKLRSSAETLGALNGVLFQYFDPVAFGIGIMGNCLLCLVFLLTPLRARPLSHVLSGLGIIDLMYVISCLVIYLSSIGKPVYDAPGLCHVTMFTAMLSRSLQAWFILLSHIDRLNAHFQSSFERRKRRVFNTKFVLIIMTMLAIALSVHVLWSFETIEYAGKTYCLPIRDSIQYHLTIRKIHVICSMVIPITIIAGVDLILLLKLALYLICRGDDDDEYDVVDHGGDYNGRQSGDSSFCTDKIVKFPLQEMKGDSCQQILANCSPMKAHLNSHLSTIKEISSDNNSSTRSFSHGIRPKELKTELDLMGIKDPKTNLHEKLSSAKKKEVAQYILTLSEEYAGAKSTCESATFPVEAPQDKRPGRKEDWVKVRSEGELQIKRDPSEGKLSPGCRRHQLGVFREKQNRLSNSYTFHSQSISHFRSCDFTSFASNVSRNTIIPEDHIFSDDIILCTVITFFSGIALAAFTIPSAFTEGKHLFLTPPASSVPSPTAIQLAIFFEFLVKFNSIYKLFLYVFVLGSFRQAFMWLLTDWIPRKVTGTLKFRAVKSSVNNDIIYV